MTDYDWCAMGTDPKHTDIWHAIAPGTTKTVCGLDAPNPDEEWRYSDRIGWKRPCDNCDKILAEKMDVPDLTPAPVETPTVTTVTTPATLQVHKIIN